MREREIDREREIERELDNSKINDIYQKGGGRVRIFLKQRTCNYFQILMSTQYKYL